MTQRILLALLPLWLAACSPPQPPPVKSSVCEMSTQAGRIVRIEATVSVNAEGNAMIGDANCPGIHLELQLSTAASRAGGDELLQSAAKHAVSKGRSSFPVVLTGVYTDATEGAQFVASSVALAAAD